VREVPAEAQACLEVALTERWHGRWMSGIWVGHHPGGQGRAAPPSGYRMTNNHATARHLSGPPAPTTTPRTRMPATSWRRSAPSNRAARLLPDDERRLSLGAFRAPAAAMLARHRATQDDEDGAA
jgi:hypothetical protein